MRKAGVLMPVSALPSRIGAGELGESAFQFIELLKENHVKIWQILPLNPVGYGNSPYQPYSSCEANSLYAVSSCPFFSVKTSKGISGESYKSRL